MVVGTTVVLFVAAAAVVALRIVDVDSYSIVGFVYYKDFVDSIDHFHLIDR